MRLLIVRRRLHGSGIGYVETSLLASCLLVPGTELWTRDRCLDAAASYLGLTHRP